MKKTKSQVNLGLNPRSIKYSLCKFCQGISATASFDHIKKVLPFRKRFFTKKIFPFRKRFFYEREFLVQESGGKYFLFSAFETII